MITPHQNLIVLSKIESREYQEQVFDLIEDQHLNNQTIEAICNMISNLEREANDQYEQGYSDCQEENNFELSTNH